MKKLLLAAAILAVLTSLIFLHCTKNIAGGTEVGNPSVAAMLYEPDGKTPAIGAKVKFYPVDNNPFPALHKTSAAIESTITDVNGRYGISTVTVGTYNIIGIKDGNKSILDSINISPTTPSIPADTLLPTGSIKGVVRLRPEHSSTNVYILIFGTNTFTSPKDSIGNFTLDSMAEGTYRVKILTTIPDYVPLDTSFTIRAGKQDTLADTIWLRYTGIPVVTGLKLSYDTMKQIVTLSWNKPTIGRGIIGYSVYRQYMGSTDSGLVKIKNAWTDTIFHDSTGIQDQTYKYFIAMMDSSNSEGVKSMGDSVKIVSVFSLVSTYGKGTGTGDGYFLGFRAIAIGDSGYFYCVDEGNNRIQKLDSSGNFITKWGSTGGNDGQFSQPVDIAVDSLSNIYVADFKNNRIQKFDRNGNFLNKWSSILNGPYRIDIKSGTIFVGEWTGKRLHKFDLDGNLIATYNMPSNISGLSVSDSFLIVSMDSLLQKYTDQGIFVSTIFITLPISGSSSRPNLRALFSDGISTYFSEVVSTPTGEDAIFITDISGNILYKYILVNKASTPQDINFKAGFLFVATNDGFIYKYK